MSREGSRSTIGSDSTAEELPYRLPRLNALGRRAVFWVPFVVSRSMLLTRRRRRPGKLVKTLRRVLFLARRGEVRGDSCGVFRLVEPESTVVAHMAAVEEIEFEVFARVCSSPFDL